MSDVERDSYSWMDPFITDQTNDIDSQWIAGINDIVYNLDRLSVSLKRRQYLVSVAAVRTH